MPINVTALDLWGGLDYSYYKHSAETITAIFNFILKSKISG
jgi:hypothetical protein